MQDWAKIRKEEQQYILLSSPGRLAPSNHMFPSSLTQQPLKPVIFLSEHVRTEKHHVKVNVSKTLFWINVKNFLPLKYRLKVIDI